MTGPDDAFLAPDDALQDFDEDAELGREDVERPAAPGGSGVEAESPAADPRAAEPPPE